MALTPLDIKNKSFANKMRGYNPDEVDEFLDQVIEDYEEAIRKNRELEKSLKHAEEKLTYFNELKDALNQSIIVAQDTADKLKDSATRESEVTVTSAKAEANTILTEAKATAEKTVLEANQKAESILKHAEDQTSQLAYETDALKKKTREFHRNLSLLLESQLEAIKSGEWDELLKPFSSYMDDSHSNVQRILSKNNAEGTEETNEENSEEVVDTSVEDGHTKAIELDEIK